MLEAIRHKLRVIRARIHEKTKARSPHWPVVEHEHLLRQPSCQACGSQVERQVHHITPFAADPRLELDPENLITLCMDKNECHLRIGHGGSFQFWNPDVVRDARYSLNNPQARDRVAVVVKIKRVRIHR